MITVAIAAILVILGIPAFNSTIKQNRLATQVNEIVTMFNLARSEAVKRGNTVSVCTTSDQASCDDDATWAQGAIIFSDLNGDGSVDDDDVIIRVTDAMSGNSTVDYAGFGGDTIQFLPTGRTNSQNGTFTLCDSTADDEYARAIILSATGRARLYINSGDSLSCTGS